MSAILKHAQDRGELQLTTIPKRLLRLPINLAHNELLITGMALSQKTIIEIVDSIFMPLINTKR
jgi:hypothetical protein